MTLDNETAVLSFINAEATHWEGKPASIASAAHLLNGGTANYVWKVQFDNSDCVVVKFFPPFVRARPVVPFAQGRSALEHTALQLIQQHCKQNAGERLWSAPKPLFYDSGMHVLVMEHVSGEGLYDLLKQPGAVSSCSASEQAVAGAQTVAADSDNDVAWIAKTVMQFLIEIASLSPTPEQISAFHTSPLIGTMNAMFSRIPNLASERYGLAPEVVNEWLARAADNESSIDSRQKLLFGDLWPNSLMVDLKRKHLYVVDWELARTGHAGVDFTQFVANLVLMERAKSFDAVAVKALRIALLDEWRVWVKANPESTRFYYRESFLKRMLQLSQYYQEEISDLKAAVAAHSQVESNAEPRKRAGVLIPLVVDHENDSIHVILTRRSFSLRTHPGEVALPGGRMDETDADISATALREAWEEIGLHPSHVRIVSTHESAISLHKLVVTPVCGIILDSVLQKSSAEESSSAITTTTTTSPSTVKHDQILQTMTLNESEVESAFAVPLSFFLDPQRHRDSLYKMALWYLWGAYAFDFTDHRGKTYFIWGLTAKVLVKFAASACREDTETDLVAKTLSMLQLNKDEVESAFAVPLQFFLSAKHHEKQEFVKNDGGIGVWRAHRFLFRGYSIFGLTAHFLVEFAVVATGKLPEFAMISQMERPQI
ncbi:hypothetical protein CcCBS67573_g04211 [Chytriomyces confervae]|uniref:Nudix hydrolase domain-containing protein n=1 Tax=Chytriomyces confervae TaxID=246404 RepID=A0A507FFZ7_9FUNG|nr:hypothetical protein CcCBS67573_g04211 [Chytriomyces confervae]